MKTRIILLVVFSFCLLGDTFAKRKVDLSCYQSRRIQPQSDGAWDYASNQQVIDRFFREGMERAADTEDLITIGMRGDGDTPMGGKEGEDARFQA